MDFVIFVNGVEHSIPSHAIDVDTRLIDFLRDELQIFSLKEGCGEGGCLSCQVMRIVSFFGCSLTSIERFS